MTTAAPLPNTPRNQARNGREHIKENFLMTTNLRRWPLLLRVLLRDRAGLTIPPK